MINLHARSSLSGPAWAVHCTVGGDTSGGLKASGIGHRSVGPRTSHRHHHPKEAADPVKVGENTFEERQWNHLLLLFHSGESLKDNSYCSFEIKLNEHQEVMHPSCQCFLCHIFGGIKIK